MGPRLRRSPRRGRRLLVTILVLIIAGSISPLSRSVAGITVGPGVIFAPSQSWANISFATSQMFGTITLDSTGVTFDGVRFGVQKYPQSAPRVEITVNAWTPLQSTAGATSVRFTATATAGSNVYLNFTYLLVHREYILQVDGVEQARKFTTASGHVSFPYAAWSSHDFNVLLGAGSGAPPNNCPEEPEIQGTPPITAFVGSSVNFVGKSLDPDGDPLSWNWSWDDGTWTNLSTPPGTSQSGTSHTWSGVGSHNVTLSVTDNVCVVTSTEFEVDVVPRPVRIGYIEGTVRQANSSTPIAGASIVVTPGGFGQTTDAFGHYAVTVAVGTYTVTASAFFYVSVSKPSILVSENQTTTVDFALSPETATITVAFDSVIDGATVHFMDRSTTDGDFPITLHQWAFGDGTSSAETSPTHTYSIGLFWSTYTVTLRACDSSGVNCGSRSKDITLVNVSFLFPMFGLFGAIALFAIAFILWRRRKRGDEEREGPEEPEGSEETEDEILDF